MLGFVSDAVININRVRRNQHPQNLYERQLAGYMLALWHGYCHNNTPKDTVISKCLSLLINFKR